nr:PAS domain-containing protein [Massilia putida]
MAQFELGDFKRMVEAMSSCVIVHDAATKAILWANPAACTVLGFTLDELLALEAPDMSARAEQYRREIGLRCTSGCSTASSPPRSAATGSGRRCAGTSSRGTGATSGRNRRPKAGHCSASRCLYNPTVTKPRNI